MKKSNLFGKIKEVNKTHKDRLLSSMRPGSVDTSLWEMYLEKDGFTKDSDNVRFLWELFEEATIYYDKFKETKDLDNFKVSTSKSIIFYEMVKRKFSDEEYTGPDNFDDMPTFRDGNSLDGRCNFADYPEVLKEMEIIVKREEDRIKAEEREKYSKPASKEEFSAENILRDPYKLKNYIADSMEVHKSQVELFGTLIEKLKILKGVSESEESKDPLEAGMMLMVTLRNVVAEAWREYTDIEIPRFCRVRNKKDKDIVKMEAEFDYNLYDDVVQAFEEIYEVMKKKVS